MVCGLFTGRRGTVLSLRACFGQGVSGHRVGRTGGVVSALVATRINKSSLSVSRLLDFYFLLLITKGRAAAGLVTGAVLALFRRPSVLGRLCESRSLVPTTVGRMLECHSPFRNVGHFIARSVRLGNVGLGGKRRMVT